MLLPLKIKSVAINLLLKSHIIHTKTFQPKTTIRISEELGNRQNLAKPPHHGEQRRQHSYYIMNDNNKDLRIDLSMVFFAYTSASTQGNGEGREVWHNVIYHHVQSCNPGPHNVV